MRIGIDLLWVRPQKNGGTESYIRNILDGFLELKSDDDFVLFVSKDNVYSFAKYRKFETVVCPIATYNFVKRVIWENLYLHTYTKKKHIDVWFFPVYSRPYTMGKVPTITVIHDLQALHYPDYFSKFRNLYFRFAWKQDCKKSTRIITISEFCKKDILEHYRINESKIAVIYNPICNGGRSESFVTVKTKYGIDEEKYYYTVCSLARHKNLITLLKAMKLLKELGKNDKLVISGVKVNAEGEIFDFINQNHLEKNIIYTGFVSDQVRNALYENCKMFLFPSVFEGFGMPPIEAMIRRVPVLTTKETSIIEVTRGLLNYVSNPYDEHEWARFMQRDLRIPDWGSVCEIMDEYKTEVVVEKYCKVFEDSIM